MQEIVAVQEIYVFALRVRNAGVTRGRHARALELIDHGNGKTVLELLDQRLHIVERLIEHDNGLEITVRLRLIEALHSVIVHDRGLAASGRPVKIFICDLLGKALKAIPQILFTALKRNDYAVFHRSLRNCLSQALISQQPTISV